MEKYLNGKLPAKEKPAFEEELAALSEQLESSAEYQQARDALVRRERPAPPPGLLDDYHANLSAAFAEPGFVETWGSRLKSLWEQLVIRPRPAVRMVEFAFLLAVGLYLGSLLFVTDMQQSPVAADNTFNPDIQFMSEENRTAIRQCLIESELLLLQVINTDPDAEIEEAEWELNIEIAQQLLKDAVPMQEQAIQVNDLKTLRFLSRMEILLYDIANLDMMDIEDALPFLKELILDTHLHIEVKMLLKTYEKPQTVPTA